MSNSINQKSNIYLVFHKPFNVLCQFTKEQPNDITLKDFLPNLPSDVYPVGRLDKDSEGLLLLTNDNRFKSKLLDPKNKIVKTYLAQVDGQVDKNAIQRLINGVKIRVNKKEYQTLPAMAKIISPPVVAERDPPIRYRKTIPTSWVKISIVEGKNRQIRKMCATVGFPVLRLIRIKIGQINMENILPGTACALKSKNVFSLI